MERDDRVPPGFFLFLNWITPEEELECLQFFDKNEWSSALSSKRPTQHFGYRYNINGWDMSLKKLKKPWGPLKKLADRIEEQLKHDGVKISQALANLYFKKTGIGAHRDKEGPLVFGVNLMDDCNMVFANVQTGEKKEVLLPRYSLYVMSGEVATKWTHAIPPRAYVYYPTANGMEKKKKPEDYKRISITFRHFHAGVAESEKVPKETEKSNLVSSPEIKSIVEKNDKVYVIFTDGNVQIFPNADVMRMKLGI